MREVAALVLGVGNRLRGDDGAGPEAAKRIAQCSLKNATVLEVRGEGLDILDAWEGYGFVVIVDAVHSGAPPGTLHRFEGDIPGGIFGRSTHTLGLAEIVALARSLGKAPERLVVHGIEGERFGMGEDLSPAVVENLPLLVKRIEAEITSPRFPP